MLCMRRRGFHGKEGDVCVCWVSVCRESFYVNKAVIRELFFLFLGLCQQ